jgi:molybdopterin converting factor small subunit
MRVLFFAQIRDFARCGSTDISVAGSADSIWSKLEQQFPGIAKFRSTTRLARNGTFTNDADRFTESDEVALIPPVSGG